MSESSTTKVSGVLDQGIYMGSDVKYVIVLEDYSAETSFVLDGIQYDFSLVFWKCQCRFDDFQHKFHLIYNEDHHAQKYGTSSMDSDGSLTVNTTKEQKTAIVIQMLEDIFEYLAFICVTFEGENCRCSRVNVCPPIIQYALWYTDYHCDRFQTYEECIQFLTCTAIKDHDFVFNENGVEWEIIPFEARWADLDEKERNKRD